jgi:serine/threonine-protein kinase
VLYIIILDFFAMPYIADVEKVYVPNVQNLSVPQARQRLRRRGLRLAVRDTVYHATIPPGLIVEQTPAERQQIKKGRRIFVEISKGGRLYTVPDVTKGSLREAQLQLEGSQLHLGEVVYVSSETIPKNVVISQRPEAGIQLPRGSAVHLQISRGSPFISRSVPDLIGLSIEVVEDTLQKHEMRLGMIQEQVDNSHPPGFILAQVPASHEQALPGTAIDLVLSVQETTATQPDTVLPLNPRDGNPSDQTSDTFPE